MGLLKGILQEVFSLPTNKEKSRQKRILAYRTEGRMDDGKKYRILANGMTITEGTQEWEDYKKGTE